MKKLMFIGFFSLMVFAMPFVSCSQTKTATATPSITYTTLDVKQAYDVQQVITGYAETSATPTKDSFLKAYASAWANLSTEAYKLKSDAVVGIHVEFINCSDNMRIVVYGTAVKYK
jgi:uncharacterized protein YbjQ (UPF0145 family)